jgi:hypothetical protein
VRRRRSTTGNESAMTAEAAQDTSANEARVMPAAIVQ